MLRTKSRHGILDAHLFHDNVHPTLAGHVALAEAVLAGLKARAAFGWPASTTSPMLDPRQCAAQFGIDAVAWAAVCDRTAVFYGPDRVPHGRSGRAVEWRDRYATAARQIRAGARPEDVGIAGVGLAAGVRRRPSIPCGYISRMNVPEERRTPRLITNISSAGTTSTSRLDRLGSSTAMTMVGYSRPSRGIVDRLGSET